MNFVWSRGGDSGERKVRACVRDPLDAGKLHLSRDWRGGGWVLRPLWEPKSAEKDYEVSVLDGIIVTRVCFRKRESWRSAIVFIIWNTRRFRVIQWFGIVKGVKSGFRCLNVEQNCKKNSWKNFPTSMRSSGWYPSIHSTLNTTAALEKNQSACD